jgi:hypothetical protein
LGSGLPDGFFSNQKSQFVLTLEGLAMENVGVFYVHLAYFTAIWYILPVLVHLNQLWYFVSRKIWQPWLVLPNDEMQLKSVMTI